MEVYPYDKWAGKKLPDFQRGETFVPDSCELQEGSTSKPKLLTEADLVGLMDKNGIGTDATIAEHIAKIIDREYVIAKKEGKENLLVPSTLGVGLVEGYNAIGFDRSLSKPHLRREVRLASCEIGTNSRLSIAWSSSAKGIKTRTRCCPRAWTNTRRCSSRPGASLTRLSTRSGSTSLGKERHRKPCAMRLAVEGGVPVVGLLVVHAEVVAAVLEQAAVGDEATMRMTTTMAVMARLLQVVVVDEGREAPAERGGPEAAHESRAPTLTMRMSTLPSDNGGRVSLLIGPI